MWIRIALPHGPSHAVPHTKPPCLDEGNGGARGAVFPVKERQEVAFLGLWWLVDEVQYDLTSVNPQAAGMGDFMKNAVVEVTLVGSGRTAE